MSRRVVRLSMVLGALLSACTPNGPTGATQFEVPPKETALGPSARATLRGSLAIKGKDGETNKISVADRTVLLSSFRGSRQPPQQTDKEGKFVFSDVPSGDYFLTASVPGTEPMSPVIVTLLNGEEKTLEPIELTRGGACTVTGKILASDGSVRVENTRVELILEPSDPQGTASANANGEFAVNVPPGSYTIRASHPSFVAKELTKQKLCGKDGTTIPPITLDLNPAKLTGRVFKETGVFDQPAEGVKVQVDELTPRLTDVNGRFDFPLLAAGEHTVRFTLADYHDPEKKHLVVLRAGPDPASLDVTLKRDRGSVTGTVSLSDGRPAEQVRISLESVEGNHFTFAAASGTDASVGTYSFSFSRVPATTYEVVASKDKYVSGRAKVVVKANEETQVSNLVLTLLKGDFVIDDKDPTNTPGMTRTTNVMLKLTTIPKDASCYRVSENQQDFSTSGPPVDGGSPDAQRADAGAALPCKPIPSSFTDAYTLASAAEGAHEVYLQFDDGAGNRGLVFSAIVILDTTAPSLDFKVEGGASFTNRSQFLNLTVDATDAPKDSKVVTSGNGWMVFNFDGADDSSSPSGADGGTGDGGTSGAAALCANAKGALAGMTLKGKREPWGRDFPLNRPSGGDGPVQVFAQVFDNAGNPSAVVCKEIVVDTVKPTGDITLLKGLTATETGYTNSPIVALTTQVSAEPFGGVLQIRLAGSAKDLATAVYVAVKGTMVFFADDPTTDGTKDVWAQLRDSAGNENTPSSKSIVLDLVPPSPVDAIVNTTIPAATRQSTVSITLSAADNHKLAAKPVALSEDSSFLTNPTVPASFSSGSSVSFSLSAGDGLKTVHIRFSDAAGNTTLLQRSIRFDTTPPSALVTLGDGSGFWNKPQPVTIGLTSPSADLAALAISTGPLDCSKATYTYSYSGSALSLPLADGKFLLSMCMKDDLGNATGTPLSTPFVVDTVAPTGSVQLTSTTTTTNLVNVSLSVTDTTSGVSEMEVTDQSAFTGNFIAFSSPVLIQLTGGEGQSAIRAQVKDRAGNVGALTPTTVAYDRTPPGGSVSVKVGSSLGPAYTTVTTVDLVHTTSADTVALALAEGSIDCARAATRYTAFSATQTYTFEKSATTGKIEDGTKVVAACYKDTAGNTSAASTSVILDTTPPEGTMVTNAGTPYTTLLIAPLTITAPADTAYMSVAQAAGSGTPVTCSFAKDCAAPKAAYVAYAANTTVSLAADGLSCVTVCLKDAAGNPSTKVITGEVTRDTAAPVVGLLALTLSDATAAPSAPSGQPRFTNARGIKLWLVGPQDATSGLLDVAFSNDSLSLPNAHSVSIALAKAGYAWNLEDGNGPRTVYARIRDNAKNTTDVQANITLDQQAPLGTIALVSAQSTKPPPPLGQKAYTTSKSVKVIYRLDGPSAQDTVGYYLSNTDLDCASSNLTYLALPPPTPPPSLLFDLDDSSEGDKTVYACFKDRAGNTSASAAKETITLDQTAPDAPAVTLNSGAEYTRDYSVLLELGQPAEKGTPIVLKDQPVRVNLSNSTTTKDCPDGNNFRPYTSPFNWGLNGTTQGPKKVYVQFKDAADNVSLCASKEITFDSIPPTAPRFVTNSGSINQSPTEVRLGGRSTDDHFARYEVTLFSDSAAGTPQCACGGSSPSSPAASAYTNNGCRCADVSNTIFYVKPVPNRPTGVHIRAVDEAGNVSLADTIVLQHDDVPPSAPVVMINPDHDASGSRVTSIYTRSTDVIVELAKPSEPIASISMRLANVPQPTTPPVKPTCPIDSTSFIPFTQPINHRLDGRDQGIKTVYVQYKDSAGNTSCASASIELDSTPPSAPRFRTLSSWTKDNPIEVKLAAAVNDTNFLQYKVSTGSLGGGTPECGFSEAAGVAYKKLECTSIDKTKTSFFVKPVENRDNVVRISAIDKAGNVSQEDTLLLQHDNLKPSAPVLFDTTTAPAVVNDSTYSVQLDFKSGVPQDQDDRTPRDRLRIQMCACDGNVADCPGAGGCDPTNGGWTFLSGIGPFTIVLPQSKTTRFNLRSMDLAGNVSDPSASPKPSFEVIIEDSTPPTQPGIGYFLGPSRGYGDVAYIDILKQSTDPNFLRYEFIGGQATTWTPVTASAAADFFEARIHRQTAALNEIQLRGVDKAGNVSAPSMPVTVSESSTEVLSGIIPDGNGIGLFGDRLAYKNALGKLSWLDLGMILSPPAAIDIVSIDDRVGATVAVHGSRAAYDSVDLPSSFIKLRDLGTNTVTTAFTSSDAARQPIEPQISNSLIAFELDNDIYTCPLVGAGISCTNLTNTPAPGTREQKPRLSGSNVAFHCGSAVNISEIQICAANLGKDPVTRVTIGSTAFAALPTTLPGAALLRSFDIFGDRLVTSEAPVNYTSGFSLYVDSLSTPPDSVSGLRSSRKLSVDTQHMAIMPATFAGRTLFVHNHDGKRRLFDLSTPDAPRSPYEVTTAFPPVVSYNHALFGIDLKNYLVLVKLDSNNPLPIPAPSAREPDLDRDRAVYIAHGEIFVTDLASGVMRNVSGALKTGTKYTPAISGDIAVWAADSGGGRHIFMANVTGGTPVQVSPAVPSPDQLRPRIDGDRIVWTDGAKIFTVQIDAKPNPPVLVAGTFKELQPASGTYDNPDVYVSGTSMRVVFERTDSAKDIYLFDEGGTFCTTTNKICQVTSTSPARESSPSISNDLVVWLDGRVSDAQRQIYAYQLAVGAFDGSGNPLNPQAPISTRLRTTSTEWDRASVRIDGRRIVWTDFRNGLSDIFLYDLDYAMEVRIAGKASGLSRPSASGNRVVYIESLGGVEMPRVWEYNPNP